MALNLLSESSAQQLAPWGFICRGWQKYLANAVVKVSAVQDLPAPQPENP